jgi:hypothetical protein
MNIARVIGIGNGTLPPLLPPFLLNILPHFLCSRPGLFGTMANGALRTIHSLLYTALKALIDMDPELYNKCEQEYDQSCRTKAHDAEERERYWQIIQGKAAEELHPNHVIDPDDSTSQQQQQQHAEDVPPQNGHLLGKKDESTMDVDSAGIIPIHMEGIPEVGKGGDVAVDGESMDVSSPPS